MGRNANKSNSRRDGMRSLLGHSDSDENDAVDTTPAAINRGPTTTTVTIPSTASTSATAAATSTAALGATSIALDEHAPHLYEAKSVRHKSHAASSWQKPLQLRTPGHTKSAKYVTWSWRMLRRKHLLALLLGALFVLYLNATRMGDDDEERITVQHYSHVPGMKGVTTEASGVHAAVMVAINNAAPPHATNASNNSSGNSQWLQSTVHSAAERSPKSAQQQVVAVPPATLALTSPGASVASAVTLAANLNSPLFATIQNSDDTSNSSLPYIQPTAADASGDPLSNVSSTPPPGYLVWSERCKMPNIDPYQPDVMKFFKREKYKPCTGTRPLTRVEFNETALQYMLLIDEKHIKSYSKSGKVACCYQSVSRSGEGANADKEISLSNCTHFERRIALPSSVESVLVSCHVKNKQVYMNGHPLIPEREEIRERLASWQRKDAAQQRPQAPSILLIGIDSISRINLIRAMPKTAQYLYDNEWFEMSGYNKIDDNTFPNIMAVLTGRNKTNALKRCNPTVVGGLDKCDFIWNTFREHGYVTAYGEDEASINTFNYLKVGFVKPPVDYYLRPFLLAAEKQLRIQKKSSLTYCLGYKHTAEFVYDYAVELALRYKNHPIFGLFWTNTFSHNNLSDCASMDQKMVDYLMRLAALGILDRTIIIFFSDHGIRFGPTRKTLSGHFEERLPFMFMWLPQHLKKLHPEFVNALSINKNRLTNPYDLHMTLKHLLAVSGRVENKTQLAPAVDCPRCQTLLEPVPHNRSCDDIAIEDHWCTCIPYQSIYRNSKTVHKLAKSAIEHINHYVSHFQNGTYSQLCRTLELDTVDSAYRAQTVKHNSLDIYRIIFYTKPNKGLFEATVRYNVSSGALDVTGEISRLNTYGKDSDCVGDNAAKKYCSCA